MSISLRIFRQKHFYDRNRVQFLLIFRLVIKLTKTNLSLFCCSSQDVFWLPVSTINRLNSILCNLFLSILVENRPLNLTRCTRFVRNCTTVYKTTNSCTRAIIYIGHPENISTTLLIYCWIATIYTAILRNFHSSSTHFILFIEWVKKKTTIFFFRLLSY